LSKRKLALANIGTITYGLIVPTAVRPLVVRRVSEVCCGASDLAAFGPSWVKPNAEPKTSAKMMCHSAPQRQPVRRFGRTPEPKGGTIYLRHQLSQQSRPATGTATGKRTRWDTRPGMSCSNLAYTFGTKAPFEQSDLGCV
jgi:hypothetical protein